MPFILAIFLALLVWQTDAAAQEMSWEEQIQAGIRADRSGDYGLAERHFRAGLDAAEKFGPEDPRLATSLNNLALLYKRQGRYAEAETLFKRSLDVREKVLGPEHPSVAIALGNLASLYGYQSRYAEAEPLHERSLAIAEKALDPNHPHVSTALSNLALLYFRQGRYAEAGPLLKRSLAIDEKALGSDHPTFSNALNALALMYQGQGRYTEAEPLFKRALAIDEKALGPEHPSVATTLNNLAQLYQGQGRYAEAEPLFKRALAIDEKALGPEHPSFAPTLNNLALLYGSQGRYADAEPLYTRSLAISEKALGPNHPKVATGLNNLATLYESQGRYAEAEPLLERSLAIDEKALGPNHPSLATTFNNLAKLYHVRGRHAEAEPLYKRALAIAEKALGPGHPTVARTLSNLVVLYRAQGRYEPVLALARQSTAILRARFTRARPSSSTGQESEQRAIRYVFINHMDLALRIDTGLSRHDGIREAFEVAQLAQLSGAAKSISRMAARFAAGSDALARLVRRRQDAIDRLGVLDGRLIRAAAQPPEKRNAAAETNLRAEIERLTATLQTLDAAIAERFPSYAELAKPEPQKLDEVQELLSTDEALLVFVRAWDKDKTHAWVLRRDRAIAYTAKIGLEALRDAVDELREGIDLSQATSLQDLPHFDTRLAHELYTKLFAPAEAMLTDVRHLFVVPDGALTGLPPGLLVTAPQERLPLDAGDYRQVPWLAKRYAMTVLPSISSLRALRVFAKRTRAAKPFVGYGDPVLDGEAGGDRGTVKFVALLRAGGALANVDAVRELPRLPDTAGELRRVAKALGATPSDAVRLAEQATEAQVRQADLAQYRVVSFATHGLVAGEVQGLPEPALVLTPPKVASPADDGLLMASEVAQLKLNADWVVLSACNTAAGDGPDGEGLSGLAKAFFYAGTRALLVSHWPVSSEATVRLMTTLFDDLARNPKLGRAEALQRAMLAMQADAAKPHFAHPAFWAPFVVVGEGGRPAAAR